MNIPAKKTVTDEQPFFIEKCHFSVGVAATDYTLQKSLECADANGNKADGTAATDWADYKRNGSVVTVTAGDQLEISDNGPGCWWRLKNNVGKVIYK